MLLWAPRILAKTLPFTVVFLFILFWNAFKKSNLKTKSLAEALFLCGGAWLAATFGTVSLEYRLLALLFLIPVLIEKRSVIFRDPEVELWLGARLFIAVFLIYSYRADLHVQPINLAITAHRNQYPLVFFSLALITLKIQTIVSGRNPYAGEVKKVYPTF